MDNRQTEKTKVESSKPESELKAPALPLSSRKKAQAKLKNAQ